MFSEYKELGSSRQCNVKMHDLREHSIFKIRIYLEYC
jgi:hypothetical protein